MFSLLSRGLPLTTLPRVSYVRHKKSRMQACCIGFLRNETAQGASPATTENAYDLPEPVFLTARPVSGAQSCLLRQESGGFAAFSHHSAVSHFARLADMLRTNYRHTAATSCFIAYLVHQPFKYTITAVFFQAFSEKIPVLAWRTFTM